MRQEATIARPAEFQGQTRLDGHASALPGGRDVAVSPPAGVPTAGSGSRSESGHPTPVPAGAAGPAAYAAAMVASTAGAPPSATGRAAAVSSCRPCWHSFGATASMARQSLPVSSGATPDLTTSATQQLAPEPRLHDTQTRRRLGA